MAKYPPTLTEMEKLELAHALSFHFDVCPDPDADHADQLQIIEFFVERMFWLRLFASIEED